MKFELNQIYTQLRVPFSFPSFFSTRNRIRKNGNGRQCTTKSSINIYGETNRRCLKEKSLTDGATSTQRIDLVASTNKRPHTRYLTKFCSFMAFLSAVETVLGYRLNGRFLLYSGIIIARISSRGLFINVESTKVIETPRIRSWLSRLNGNRSPTGCSGTVRGFQDDVIRSQSVEMEIRLTRMISFEQRVSASRFEGCARIGFGFAYRM